MKPLNCKKLQLSFLQTVRSCAGYHTHSACTLRHTLSHGTRPWDVPPTSCSGLGRSRVVGNRRMEGGREGEEKKEKKGRKKLSFCTSRITGASGRSRLNHTWLIVFSICTKPRLGSVLFIKSTMVSRFSCCRIKGLWLPSRLRATLNMTSDPWRKIISGKTQKSQKLIRTQLLIKQHTVPFTNNEKQDSGKHNPKLQDPDISDRVLKIILRKQCMQTYC